MEEYIVSARKYRPTTFESVVGQKALTTTLKNAVKSGKLAHAYLFCGPRGVGKTTCARIFAKTINCLTPTSDGEACNHCESCSAFNEQRSYNIFELDAASNNSVENIKTLMEQTRIPPQVGKYKVFIIDEVHMLSTAAFNAFLKTLEEPPAHVIFILATTEKHKILPTIISRCQIYDFERMAVQDIINHLENVAKQEGISYEPNALNVIAEKADGGMRDALSIFDQAVSFSQGNITYSKVIEDLNVLDAENYFNMVDLAWDNKVSELMLLLNNVVSHGFDYGNVSSGLASHIRNVLMAKDTSTLSLIEASEQQRKRYAEQAQKCSTTFLYKALKILNSCDVVYKQSSNKALLVELTLIEVAQITQPDDSDGASSGHSPKRLKSLFKLLLANSKNITAQQVAGSNLYKDVSKETSQMPIPTKESEKPQSTESKPTTRPKLKLSDIGVTFASLRKKDKEKEQKEVEELTETTQEKHFTQDDVRMQWLMMCNRMPAQMQAMATRMKNMIPTITTYPTLEVVVGNSIFLQQLQAILGRIRASMAKGLENGNIEITLRLAEEEELKPILSKKELFIKLIKENKAFEKLAEGLNLELS